MGQMSAKIIDKQSCKTRGDTFIDRVQYFSKFFPPFDHILIEVV